ncbi:hypothetical protein JD844_031820 [Phrynosoma platyrhinos]|uniref:Uncharacterized protein n=1 Tax=Phrynosoma platyrhinos TaxID=52577 RepID=A0ABQ7T4L6_PHRPL|nr:hypothetical protein JD844_031820 [Phrynosoma platyrhinos]
MFPIAGSVREPLQAKEEPTTSPTTAVPTQFKQRTPMYNSNANVTAATPTSPVTPPATTPATQAPQATTQQAPPKKSLSLTREQMYAAQEMFKTANKVTRPEKALILGFMAGSRGIQLWGRRRWPDPFHRTFENRPTVAYHADNYRLPSFGIKLSTESTPENPCQEQGDIIQIKLSEHTEVLPKADGTGSTTMLVDTVFEMNYATGQWTRLKKYKPITNVS